MFILFIIVFINLVGFGIIIPLLPFYGEHYGASPDQVTLLMALYSAAQLVSAPLWGRLSDKYGRKPILLVSLFGTVLAYIGLAVAPDLISLYLTRAWGGVMAGSISSAFAYMADITSDEDRAKGMGLIGAAFGLGFIAGPAIGGFLAGSDVANTNFTLPSYTAAGFSGLALILATFILKESLPPELRSSSGSSNRGWARFTAMITQPEIRNILILTFMSVFVFAALEATFAMWTERTLGWGVAQNGYVFAYTGIFSAFIQGVLIGPMAKKWGLPLLIKQGLIGLLLGLLIIPFAETIWSLLIGMTVVTYGFSLTSPALSGQLSLQISGTNQGSILGMSRSVSTLARALGPACSGYVFVFLGKDWPFLIGALLIFIVLLTSFIVRPSPTKNV